MESTDIFIDADNSGVRQVQLAPVVLFNVLDHFIRRSDSSQRVIGTLLGRVASNGEVYVSDSFPLPHFENGGDEVAVDSEYFTKMYELHRRVQASAEVVGWYATGTETDIKSVIIHEFYGRHCVSPVHVLVDAALGGVGQRALDARAFVSSAYKIRSLALSSEFHPVPVAIKPDRAERVGLDTLFKNKRREEDLEMELSSQQQDRDHSRNNSKRPVVLASQIDNLETSMQKLLDLLDTVGRNVDAVVTGEIEGDVNTGRFLAETLTMVPRMNNAEFERLFGDNMRDLLMVAYLCKLTKSQLLVGEKLLGIDVPGAPASSGSGGKNSHHQMSNGTVQGQKGGSGGGKGAGQNGGNTNSNDLNNTNNLGSTRPSAATSTS